MSRRGALKDMRLMGRIGYRVWKMRERQGVSMEELAATSRLHVNTVMRTERGEGCSVTVLVKLAEALKVQVSDLTDEAPERPVVISAIAKDAHF